MDQEGALGVMDLVRRRYYGGSTSRSIRFLLCGTLGGGSTMEGHLDGSGGCSWCDGPCVEMVRCTAKHE